MKSREFEVWELDKAYVLKCIQLTDELSAKIDLFIKTWPSDKLKASTFKRFLNSEKIQYTEIIPHDTSNKEIKRKRR